MPIQGQPISNECAKRYLEAQITDCDRGVAASRRAVEMAIERARKGGPAQNIAARTDDLQGWLKARERLEAHYQALLGGELQAVGGATRRALSIWSVTSQATQALVQPLATRWQRRRVG
jgi:hypothetical protein